MIDISCLVNPNFQMKKILSNFSIAKVIGLVPLSLSRPTLFELYTETMWVSLKSEKRVE